MMPKMAWNLLFKDDLKLTGDKRVK